MSVCRGISTVVYGHHRPLAQANEASEAALQIIYSSDNSARRSCFGSWHEITRHMPHAAHSSSAKAQSANAKQEVLENDKRSRAHMMGSASIAPSQGHLHK